jgi:hypothetical protein
MDFSPTADPRATALAAGEACRATLDRYGSLQGFPLDLFLLLEECAGTCEEARRRVDNEGAPDESLCGNCLAIVEECAQVCAARSREYPGLQGCALACASFVQSCRKRTAAA